MEENSNNQNERPANPYSRSTYDSPASNPYAYNNIPQPTYVAPEPITQQPHGWVTKPTWTQIFLGVIALVFVGQLATGQSGGFGLGNTKFDTLVLYGGLNKELVQAGEWWRIFTSMFLHFGIIHIMFNGFALYSFGAQLEQLIGSKRFVAIYLLSGVGGSALTLFLENRNILAAGASGAIFGLLGALIGFFYRHREIMGAWGRANLKGLLITAALNFFITLSLPGIGQFAHLGGLLSGLFLGYLLSPLVAQRPATVANKIESGNDFVNQWWPAIALVIVQAVMIYVSIV